MDETVETEQKIEILHVGTGDAAVPVRLRRSRKAFRMRLRVLSDGTAEAVLPQHCSPDECEQFIRQNLGWLRRTIQQRKTVKKPQMLFPVSLHLPYLGGNFSVSYQFLPVRWTGAKCLPEEKKILVTGNVLDAESVHGAFQEMLKVCTVRCIFPHLEGLASKYGFQPGPLSVRLQKGRWGSCSSRGGAISLNAMLVFLPEEIVEYILIHELCHLRQMNHSESFWKEVAEYCPDYMILRQRLRTLEKTLSF